MKKWNIQILNKVDSSNFSMLENDIVELEKVNKRMLKDMKEMK